MKQYIKPNMLVIAVCKEDVIATSGATSDDTSGIRTNQGNVLDPENVKDSVDF